MEDKNLNKLSKEIGIERSYSLFKKVFVLSLFITVSMLAVTLLVFFKSQDDIRDLKNKVIVLDKDGNTYQGEVNEMNENELIKLKAQNVMRTGIDYMFSFSSGNIDSRLNLAKSYFGKSGNEILTTYKNQDVRQKVIQNNLRVEISIKSIKVVYENNEPVGYFEFEQSFINGSLEQKRNVTGKCTFENVKVSENNAYGIVINEFLYNTK